MKIVILDFTDCKVKIVNLENNIQCEEIETILSEEYGISTSNIEYMVVPTLEIETLN